MTTDKGARANQPKNAIKTITLHTKNHGSEGYSLNWSHNLQERNTNNLSDTQKAKILKTFHFHHMVDQNFRTYYVLVLEILRSHLLLFHRQGSMSYRVLLVSLLVCTLVSRRLHRSILLFHPISLLFCLIGIILKRFRQSHFLFVSH
eukprot:UN31176